MVCRVCWHSELNPPWLTGFSLQTLGCVPAVPGYLKAMKKVCDKYGALLILDGSLFQVLYGEQFVIDQFHRSDVRYGSMRIAARMAARRRRARYPDCRQRPRRRICPHCRTSHQRKSDESVDSGIWVPKPERNASAPVANMDLEPFPTAIPIRDIQLPAPRLLRCSV